MEKENNIEREVEVHLYRTSDIKPNDYAFSWCGKLPCSYINVINGTKEKHIHIENRDRFFQSLNEFSKDTYISYHPVIYWKVRSENTFGIVEISKLHCPL